MGNNPDTRISGRTGRGSSAEVDDAELTDLWMRFWATRDRSLRNELILAYRPVVHTVASRLPISVRSNWELDDLESFGVLGLIEAIDRFDESSQIQAFPGYAQRRIRGAIYDEFRRLDWLPRTIRRRVITYRATVDDLSSELGRVPERAEVMNSMGLDANAESDLMQQVQSAQLTHFEQADEDDHWTGAYRAIDNLISDTQHNPEPQFLAAERMSDLREALTQLPERQRTVITLHFLGGLTQAQIGAILSVSNSRISQIEAAAIESLRRTLQSDTSNFFSALG